MSFQKRQEFTPAHSLGKENPDNIGWDSFSSFYNNNVQQSAFHRNNSDSDSEGKKRDMSS